MNEGAFATGGEGKPRMGRVNHKEILLAPIVAFPVYLVLVTLISGFGRVLAGPTAQASASIQHVCGRCEKSPVRPAVPGYGASLRDRAVLCHPAPRACWWLAAQISPDLRCLLVGVMLALVALILE